MSGVYAWIETFDGAALGTGWEALGAGRALADVVGGPLTAIILGENAEAIAAEAARYGAEAVIICEDATLTPYRLDPYAALLAKLVTEAAPRFVVAVGTSRARELLAAAAADTDSGMVTEVTAFTAQPDGALTLTRPAYAGKVISEVTAAPGGMLFMTLRARAFAPLAPGEGAAAPVEWGAPALAGEQIGTHRESVRVEVGSVNLSDAAIIVSGGRGMAGNPKDAPADAADAAVWKAQDGFANTLGPLAETLGAALGASRAAVDAGYIAYAHQVGQTGKTVSPDLYIACGISGAIQHQAGMRTSRIIVAINKDASAPIFRMARYGLVGDLYAIVPALTAELKRRLDQ